MASESDGGTVDSKFDEDDERGEVSPRGAPGSDLTRADGADSGPPEELPDSLQTPSWARAHAIHLVVGAVAVFMILSGLVDMLTK